MNKDTLNNRYCDYNNFKRARYFHGMLMTDRDFREEQIYHIEKRKMLNKMLHGWGVVCGLGITGKTGGSTFTISKGMALDCHGNEIVMCKPYSIDITSSPCMGKRPTKTIDCKKLTETTDKSNIYYIGIRYNEIPTDAVPAYIQGGGCEEKACDNSRFHEGFCIKLFDIENPPEQPQIPGIDPSLIKRLIETGMVSETEGTSIRLSQNASSEPDYYNNMQITIISGKGRGQTRTITDYLGSTKQAIIGTEWEKEKEPDNTSFYGITNFNCLPETLKEFSNAFCTTPLVCPDCCPDEHYIILGKVEMNAGKTIIKEISNDDRSYVMTPNLFKYIFSSLLGGLDELYPNGKIMDLPINLIHTNPIQAMCRITQIIVNAPEKAIGSDTGMSIKSFLPELHSLKEEITELNQTVEKYKEDVTNLKKTMELYKKKLNQ